MGGVEVGIADKKWGSDAACGPRTRKSGGQLTIWTQWLLGPWVGEFLPTNKFSPWETLLVLPHGRYITGSRQTLARVMRWHELTL